MGSHGSAPGAAQMIRAEYDPTRPAGHKWMAWDTETYDGAPDSSNRDQLGFGDLYLQAIADLQEKLQC